MNMPRRKIDWLKQAKRDFEHSRMDFKEGFYELACFSAQQAAEKSLKALYQEMHKLAWGHSVRELLENLDEEFDIEHLLGGAKILGSWESTNPYGPLKIPLMMMTAQVAKFVYCCCRNVPSSPSKDPRWKPYVVWGYRKPMSASSIFPQFRILPMIMKFKWPW